MIYDPNRWNWQDTVVAILACAGVPCFVIGYKWLQFRMCMKLLAERKRDDNQG